MAALLQKLGALFLALRPFLLFGERRPPLGERGGAKHDAAAFLCSSISLKPRRKTAERCARRSFYDEWHNCDCHASRLLLDELGAT